VTDTKQPTPPTTGAHPIRIKLGNILDVLLVHDPKQIQWLNQHPDVEREFDPTASLLHRIIDKRLKFDLAFDGKVLPVFRARKDKQREDEQDRLHQRLENLRGAPGEDRDHITDFVSGKETAEDIGVIVQQWCGRLFSSHYRASKEVYDAGKLLAEWPVTLPLRAFLHKRTGKLDAAKKAVLDVADNDVHCVHATSIGMNNLARTVRKLRGAAHAIGATKLAPDEVLRTCLTVPPAVLRSCTREIDAPFLSKPLTSRTLVVFLVAKSFATSGDLDDAFLGEQWSACPARDVIPEMLRAVWYAAHREETSEEVVLEKINTWSRIIKAVS
jgi:hypothetical protein